MSRLFSNSGIPLTTFRVIIKIIPEEQIKAEREEADRAFMEDRTIAIDPSIAYERDIEIRFSHIVQFTQRLDELSNEFEFYNI